MHLLTWRKYDTVEYGEALQGKKMIGFLKHRMEGETECKIKSKQEQMLKVIRI